MSATLDVVSLSNGDINWGFLSVLSPKEAAGVILDGFNHQISRNEYLPLECCPGGTKVEVRSLKTNKIILTLQVWGDQITTSYIHLQFYVEGVDGRGKEIGIETGIDDALPLPEDREEALETMLSCLSRILEENITV